MPRKTSPARQAAFFAALRATGNQAGGAERARVTFAWGDKHRRQDPEFQRALDASFLKSTHLEAGDAMRYRRDEVPPRVLRRLGQGDYAAQDELDLHHADSAQAEALLRRFLKEARDAGIGCVRVIHGKGLHGDSRVPVLKNLVDRLLRQRADVLAFHSAPAAQGGNGAVLVLLKPR